MPALTTISSSPQTHPKYAASFSPSKAGETPLQRQPVRDRRTIANADSGGTRQRGNPPLEAFRSRDAGRNGSRWVVRIATGTQPLLDVGSLDHLTAGFDRCGPRDPPARASIVRTRR